MSKTKHKVEQQAGVSIHREIPEMRSSADFDVSQMSIETRAAWDKVCNVGGATPEDFRRVFASIMSSGVVDVVLK